MTSVIAPSTGYSGGTGWQFPGHPVPDRGVAARADCCMIAASVGSGRLAF